MSREGLLRIIRRTVRYEKPTQYRRQMAYDRCKAIYNEDMDRKIDMLMKKNRKDPFPGLAWVWQSPFASFICNSLKFWLCLYRCLAYFVASMQQIFTRFTNEDIS